MQYFAYLRRNPNAAPDGNFNGYRVELSEIQDTLLQQPEVENALVSARTTSKGEAQIIRVRTKSDLPGSDSNTEFDVGIV